jgi:hypothetical protein
VETQIWCCDTCGESITDPKAGLVVWKTIDDDDPAVAVRGYDFKIVHKTLSADQRAECDPGNKAGYFSSMDVADFLGADGLTQLLGMLAVGPMRPSSPETPAKRKVLCLSWSQRWSTAPKERHSRSREPAIARL